MPVATDGGGGGTLQGSVPWPQVDIGALLVAQTTLAAQAKSVAGAAGDLAGTPGKVSSWSGTASDQWHANVKMGVSGLDDISERLGSAGRILNGLFGTIQGLQADYQAAAAQEQSAQQALVHAHTGGGHHHPPGTLTVGSLAWILREAERIEAVKAEQQAVDQLHHAASTAANRLSGLLDGLPKQLHLYSGGAGTSPAAPSRAWMVLLLGTVADNRLSGLSFQQLVTTLLGVRENTTNYQVRIRLPNGSYRWVTTRPDSTGPEDDQVIEMVVEAKNVDSQYWSSQIRAQMELAREEGVPFQLIAAARTKLTGPLRAALRALAEEDQQGDVPPFIQSQGDGTGTGLDGEGYTANPTTHQWEQIQPGGKPPPDGPTTPSAPSGGEGGGGGSNPEPEPEPDPEDPFPGIDPLDLP